MPGRAAWLAPGTRVGSPQTRTEFFALRRGLDCSMGGLMRGVVEADDEWFREVCLTEAAANGREPVPVP